MGTVAATHGDRLHAGAELRFLDIPADTGRCMGAFDNVHDTPGADLVEMGKNFAERLTHNATRAPDASRSSNRWWRSQASLVSFT